MGGNSPEDERRFETAKRVSDMNLEAYRKYMQPWVKSMVTPQMAELMRNWHPARVQYEAFSSENPLMKTLESVADKTREQRKPVAQDNPFLAFQEKMSKQIVSSLDQWRDSQEALSEAMFLAIYGSPALQSAVGVDPKSTVSRRREMEPKHRELLQARIAELKSKIGSGGLREASIRALLYVGSVRGMVDERSLEALRRLRQTDESARVTWPNSRCWCANNSSCCCSTARRRLRPSLGCCPRAWMSDAGHSQPFKRFYRRARKYQAKWRSGSNR